MCPRKSLRTNLYQLDISRKTQSVLPTRKDTGLLVFVRYTAGSGVTSKHRFNFAPCSTSKIFIFGLWGGLDLSFSAFWTVTNGFAIKFFYRIASPITSPSLRSTKSVSLSVVSISPFWSRRGGLFRYPYSRLKN